MTTDAGGGRPIKTSQKTKLLRPDPAVKPDFTMTHGTRSFPLRMPKCYGRNAEHQDAKLLFLECIQTGRVKHMGAWAYASFPRRHLSDEKRQEPLVTKKGYMKPHIIL